MLDIHVTQDSLLI